MAGGRPRTTSPTPKKLIELGKEMIQWLMENPDTLHLSEWYSIHKMILYKDWKAIIQHKEFLPYYEQALKIVGRKYVDKNSNVRDGISQRWQRIYFPDLREQEDKEVKEKAERELEIKKKAIDHEYSLKEKMLSTQQSPPNDSIIEIQNENMLLKARLAKYESN